MAHIKRLDEIFPIYRSKRKYRDVFFRTLFGEDKKALLELYNALNGTDLNNPDDLTTKYLSEKAHGFNRVDESLLLITVHMFGIINICS